MLSTILQVQPEQVANNLTNWILGALSSILLVALSVFISRIYKLIDTLFDKVNDNKSASEDRAHINEDKFNALDKRVATIEIGLMKDIENLTKSFNELNDNVKKLNENFTIMQSRGSAGFNR